MDTFANGQRTARATLVAMGFALGTATNAGCGTDDAGRGTGRDSGGSTLPPSTSAGDGDGDAGTGVSGGAGSEGDPGTTSTPDTAGTDATGGTESTGSGGDSDSTSGPPSRFDIEVPPEETAGPTEDEGCQKVDFLFVIDNSNSMATNQAELINSFPEFVDRIQMTLEDVESFHVGVVSSDEYEGNPANCREFGALVTQTAGVNSSNATCTPYAQGGNFMTEQDDLAMKFACAAQIGTGGANDEWMMQSAVRAVAPDMNAAGACNEGFIRDDALLVLVIITDEDDPGTGNLGSPGDPNSWLADILAVKGAAANVVALALVRGTAGNVCGFPQGTERDGTRLMEFTALLGANGLNGDICAASFGPLFDQAVGLIDSACDGFMPPG